jgi:hypothetical protein
MPGKPRTRRRIRPRLCARQPRPANPSTDLRLHGVAAALGSLARDHRQPDLAAIVLDSLGLTLADLKRAGADAYDLAAFTAINSRLAEKCFDLAAAEPYVRSALNCVSCPARSASFLSTVRSRQHASSTLSN